jgi:glutamate-1-semialdehyde 2,1-aminomutase
VRNHRTDTGQHGTDSVEPGFLEELRKLTADAGALLILDEVISGFRVARGGAQELFGIHADLTTLGKIIGGGLPVGAFGGRGEIMDCLAPTGPVYQAGTLSGNPLAMAAGIATLEELKDYRKLEDSTAKLCAQWPKAGVKQYRIGSIFCHFFTNQEVTDYASAKTCDTKRYAKFFHAMLERGVYLAPSQFEVGFVSLAHTDEDIEKTVRAAREAVKAI